MSLLSDILNCISIIVFACWWCLLCVFAIYDQKTPFSVVCVDVYSVVCFDSLFMDLFLSV